MEIEVIGGAGLRVIHPPRWTTVTFCLAWAAIVVSCLLVWAGAIELLLTLTG